MTGLEGQSGLGVFSSRSPKEEEGSLRCIFSNLSLNTGRQAFMVREYLRSPSPQGQHLLPF